MPDSDTTGEQNDSENQREHHRRRQVRLDHHQDVQSANHHQKWQQSLRQTAQLVTFLDDQHRPPDNDTELG